MSPLITHLREATAASHQALDGAFGSLNLSNRSDFVRFLSGHAIGMAPLYDRFRAFIEEDLEGTCPDFPAMLRADLAALGVDTATLPQVTAPNELTKAATAYVVAGSRLGLAMIRKAGYWGSADGMLSAYMEDDTGRAIWKEVAARFKAHIPDDVEAARERAAAVAAFETFRQAFAASGEVHI